MSSTQPPQPPADGDRPGPARSDSEPAQPHYPQESQPGHYSDYPAGYPASEPPSYQQPGYPAQSYPDHQTQSYDRPAYQPQSYDPHGYQTRSYEPQSYPPRSYDPQSYGQAYPTLSSGTPGGHGQPGQPGQPGSIEAELPPRSRSRRALIPVAVLAALLGGGVGGGIVAIAEHNRDGSVNTGLKITNATGAPAAQLNGTVGAAASKIRPSVVTIGVTAAQESGTGSGVIIRPDGYILTNDHVVDIGNGTGTIRVVLSDGRNATAKVVGRDTSDDLAVIKVDGLSGLTAATFAKSSSLSVGQSVVAVGAPLGLSDTVTSGIVSNLARPVRAGDNDQAVFEAVQTDAAINPGNSGGPLVDLNGSVVGINAAIASDSSGGGLQIPGQPAQQSGNIGIGFAIPADEASRIAGELIANGKATHAILGVEVGGASSTTPSVDGVPLHSVTAGGVAAKAGLKVGDVVTSVNDQRVSTSDGLIAAVRSHAPGEQVKINYTRGGTSSSVQVTLGSSNS